LEILRSWTVFVKHFDNFTQVYNSCLRPTMTHSIETQTLTNQAKTK